MPLQKLAARNQPIPADRSKPCFLLSDGSAISYGALVLATTAADPAALGKAMHYCVVSPRGTLSRTGLDRVRAGLPRSWQVGDVTISRIVEVWDFQDNINMTIIDARLPEFYSGAKPGGAATRHGAATLDRIRRSSPRRAWRARCASNRALRTAGGSSTALPSAERRLRSTPLPRPAPKLVNRDERA